MEPSIGREKKYWERESERRKIKRERELQRKKRGSDIERSEERKFIMNFLCFHEVIMDSITIDNKKCVTFSILSFCSMRKFL